MKRQGFRDPGELDPLDDDCDDNGYKDSVEKPIGTNPLNQNSWPWIICVDDQCPLDERCDQCAADITSALTADLRIK